MSSMVTPSVNSFNGGEFSPLMLGRFDLEKYYSGCKTLKNFIGLPFGSVQRRPGTLFMGYPKYADKKCRLLKFKFSSSVYCMIEFGDQYFRFWTEDGFVPAPGNASVPYEVAHPYLEADLFDVHITPSADTIFFAHNSYYPYMLVRNDDNNWTMDRCSFEPPPFDKVNVTDTTLTPADTSVNTTITASDDLFTEDDFHSIWSLTQPRTDNIIEGEFTEDGVSTSTKCYEGFNLLTNGAWCGEITVQRSDDNGTTWTDVRSFVSSDDYNVDYNGNEEYEGVLYRLSYKVDTEEEDTGTCRYTFTVNESYIDCNFKITEIVDTKTVKAEFNWTPLCNTNPTKLWRRSVWTKKYGYPSTVFIHESRLGWASNIKYPERIWMSQINDWYNFTTGDLDTDALEFNPPSSEVIQWVLSGQVLMIGTEGMESVLGSTDTDTPLTPTNVPKVKKQSTNGSSHLQAVMLGDCVLYAQSYSKIINEFAYTFSEDKYNSPNMTLLADHITGNGITQMDYALHPEQILWCVREDGQLLSFTYNREQQIMGWSRHIIANGQVESVGVIPNYTVNEDSPWVVVNREINGSTMRTIERIGKRAYTSISEFNSLDAAMSFDGGDNVNISNISYDDTTYYYTVTTSTAHNLSNGNDVKMYNCGSLSYRVIPKIEIVDATTFKSYAEKFPFEVTETSFCNRVENTFTNLNHLEGLTVYALMDGAVSEQQTVTDGKVSFKEYGNKVFVGVYEDAICEPMPFVIKLSGGFSEPHALNLTKVIVKFYETLGATVVVSSENNPNGTSYYPKWRTIDDTMGKAVEPLNQIVDQECNVVQTGREINVKIVQSEPLPCTIVNIFPELSISA